MNIDPLNPVGMPTSNPGFPAFRFPFNVSQAGAPVIPHSNQNLDTAFRVYDPVIDRLRSWGSEVMIVLTHQTHGEGAGFNWSNMREADWLRWGARLAEFAGVIAHRYRGKVRWYQVGNEHDQASVAAIGIPPVDYGKIFAMVHEAIRRADPTVEIIPAGMVSGAVSGRRYLQQAGILHLVRSVAMHPYGQGGLSNPDFAPFGRLRDFIAQVRPLNKRVLFTEMGLLDVIPPTAQAARYLRDFLTEARASGIVDGVFWYGWSDGMHNGMGFRAADGTLRKPLFDAYRTWSIGIPPAPDDPPQVTGPKRIGRLLYPGNFRPQPSTSNRPYRLAQTDDVFTVWPESVVRDSNFTWYPCADAGGTLGWIAERSGKTLFADYLTELREQIAALQKEHEAWTGRLSI